MRVLRPEPGQVAAGLAVHDGAAVGGRPRARRCPARRRSAGGAEVLRSLRERGVRNSRKVSPPRRCTIEANRQRLSRPLVAQGVEQAAGVDLADAGRGARSRAPVTSTDRMSSRFIDRCDARPRCLRRGPVSPQAQRGEVQRGHPVAVGREVRRVATRPRADVEHVASPACRVGRIRCCAQPRTRGLGGHPGGVRALVEVVPEAQPAAGRAEPRVHPLRRRPGRGRSGRPGPAPATSGRR